MPPSLLLLLLLLLSSAAHAQTQLASMDSRERESLFLLMEAMSDDANWRQSHPDPCSSPWPGLDCQLSDEDRRLHVTRLAFGAMPNPSCIPSATFPSHVLLSFPHLRSLFFHGCFRSANTSLDFQVTRQPPPLQQMSLKANPALVGTIPPLIASLRSLEVLTLSQNRLTGKIPDGVFALVSLVHVDLSYNHITGTLPAQLGGLVNLAGLDLSYNSLSGAIPTSIGELGLLQKLDLSSNKLTGSIPGSVGRLRSLSFLALSNNRLHGPFPEGLQEGLQGLQYVILDGNPMNTELPAELGGLRRLRELRLASCGFYGPIPESFAGLANLTTLSLEDNRLTGAIPAALGRLGRIYHMNLSGNMLAGAVPFEPGFMRRMGRNLDLRGNEGLCVHADAGQRADVGVGVCGEYGRSVGMASGPESREMSLLRGFGMLCCCFLCLFDM